MKVRAPPRLAGFRLHCWLGFGVPCLAASTASVTGLAVGLCLHSSLLSPALSGCNVCSAGVWFVLLVVAHQLRTKNLQIELGP